MLLKQVFVNLLSNAIKFTRRRELSRIEIGHRVQGGAAICFVKDNGAGFAMTDAAKLFEVFQRLHRPDPYEGTGVGLCNVTAGGCGPSRNRKRAPHSISHWKG